MLVLIGFMGAGKSTIGRLLAHSLGLPFLDADQVIEAEQGTTIAQIFTDSGEAGFRRVEAETITRLLAGPDAVLSLGGGAVGSPSVREALAGHQVVLLDVSLDEVLRRVGGDGSRPMLARNLPELFASRQGTYREAATVVVPVTGRSRDEVAAAVLAALGSETRTDLP